VKEEIIMSGKTSDVLTQRVLELLRDSDDERLSAIRRLYEGEITPVQLNPDVIPGHREAMRGLIEARQKVDALLETHPEMETAFEAYRNALYAVNTLELFEQFANGFSLAVRLFVESVDK